MSRHHKPSTVRSILRCWLLVTHSSPCMRKRLSWKCTGTRMSQPSLKHLTLRICQEVQGAGSAATPRVYGCGPYLRRGRGGHGRQQQRVAHAVRRDVAAQAVPLPALAGRGRAPHVVLQLPAADRRPRVRLVRACPRTPYVSSIAVGQEVGLSCGVGAPHEYGGPLLTVCPAYLFKLPFAHGTILQKALVDYPCTADGDDELAALTCLLS